MEEGGGRGKFIELKIISFIDGMNYINITKHY
jgi:hypothetical protein